MERIISTLTTVFVVTLLCAAAVTTGNSQDKTNVIDINALAAQGEAIVNEDTDPLVIDFRNRYPDGPVRRGFNVGMAAALGHTAPGPGKERICASLPQGESSVCSLAAFFSVDRNKYTNFAARGAALAREDPRRINFARTRAVPDLVDQQGFNIGMAAAEGQTAPGPGKQKIHDSLSPGAQSGFSTAVSYSLDRNRFSDLAAKGFAIANADPAVMKARGRPNLLSWLGFDIATGIFGDPALGAQGNTATGPGSLGIRDALSESAQYGFNESVKFHLGRSYRPRSEVRTQSQMEVTRVQDTDVGDEVLEQANDDASATTAAPTRNETARDSPVVTKGDHFGRGGASGRARAAFQPENTIKISVKYKKEFGYQGETDAFGYVGPTSCSAFSISVAIGDGSLQQTNPTRIKSDSKMEESGGYYFCNYFASDIPLNQPVQVSVKLSDIGQFDSWKGGNQTQPPPGQQRTIIIVSGREESPLTLTATQPRARQLYEMVYAPASR